MLRASILRARSVDSRRGVLVLAAASVVFLAGLARGGTSVNFERQANGQTFSDVYLDGNNQQQTYSYTWPDNANWSQSKQLGSDPAGRQIVTAPSNWSQDTYPTGDYDVSLGGAQVTDDVSVSVDTLSLSGELDILGSQTLTVTNGSLVNDGTIVVNWDTSSFGTALIFNSDASISGTGNIVLNNDGAYAQIDSQTGTLTIGAGQNISGLGQINGTFINNGVIKATIAGGSMDITGTMTNNKTINADDGGTLTFNGTMTNNGGLGVVGSGTNSNLVLSGTINNTGNGLVAVGGNLYMDSVAIDGGLVLASLAGAYVQVNGGSTLSNTTFTLGGGDHLDIQTASTLTFGGTMTLENDGTITVNADKQTFGTALYFDSDVTIQGGGDIFLAEGGAYSQFNTINGHTVTLGSGQTLHGSGAINAAIINQGTINADTVSGSLDIGSFNIENDNLMEATNHSAMNITAITIANSTGTISASDLSVVNLSGVTIDGGAVSAAAGSSVVWTNSTMSGSITLSGTQDIPTATVTTMNGSVLTNNGKIVINPSQDTFGTAFNIDADASLTGSGEILLNMPGAYAQLNVVNSHTLTIENSQLVHGQGMITGDIVNYGNVTADVAGQTLQVSPLTDFANWSSLSATNDATLQLTGPFSNHGTIAADSGGTLMLTGATATNLQEGSGGSDGEIQILGELTMSGSTIAGGTLDASASGASLLVANSSTIENTSFTLGAGDHLNVQAGNTLAFGGTMTLLNNGTITVNVNQQTFGTALNFDSDITIQGNGDILLARGGAYSQFNTLDSHTITLGSGQTLHGSGAITAAIINHGTINADTASGSLDIGSFNIENDNLMEATNHSALNINSITITNSTGTISASNQSVVNLNGATINGGQVSASAGSSIVWTNAMMSGSITLSGTQNIPAATVTTMNGSVLTNNGKIVINPEQDSFGTVFNIDADATLTGSGQVLLNYGGSYAQLNVINNHTLTVGSAQLIHGQGMIIGNLVNHGTIRADVAGQILEIAAPLTNSGTLDVVGGILQLDQGLSNGSVIAQLRSGDNNGNWNGAGIISSLAAAHRGTAVGYTNSSGVYTLMYTWLGDTNLDGIVDNDDLAAISLTGTTWATGDFNYDGVVNSDDYALFMLGAAHGSRNISATLPEPSVVLGLIALCGSLPGRRRLQGGHIPR
jgi:hypothetical protein